MPTKTKEPVLATEEWPIKKFIHYVRNPRKNDDQVDRMVASIKEFGFRIPVVAKSDGTVVDGHLRLKAAAQLGMDTVPVALADELTDAQIKAFRLLANRSAQWADWDWDLLKLEVEDLQELQFDIDMIGFNQDELDRLFEDTNDGLTDPDEVPPEPEEAISKEGQIWKLGKHRLMCGSSTNEEHVKALLAGVEPHLMVTDPPYGVDYDPEWRKRAGINDSKRMGAVVNDAKVDWSDAWKLFSGDVAYVWHGAIHTVPVAESLVQSGFDLRSQIIWVKDKFALSRGNYHYQHEPCWYVVRKNGHWRGGRNQSTVWQITRMSGIRKTLPGEDATTTHSTQKPVEAMKRPIENNSSPGQAVYEPFSGSGTTIIAAEMTGRACYAMEIHPPYVDMAVQRWENFTGQKAELLG